jgi:hypothetical protein
VTTSSCSTKRTPGSHAYAQPPASRPSLHSFWGRPRRTWETDQCW